MITKIRYKLRQLEAFRKLILKNPKNFYDVIKYRCGRSCFGNNKNADKTFYIIRRLNFSDGFFANFMFVLDHIIIACEEGWIPVVDMKNYNTLYSEGAPINGTKNAWEYYFEQPTAYTLEEVYKSKHVVFSNSQYPNYKALYYKQNANIVPERKRIELLYNYTQKYIQLNPNSIEYIQSKQQDFNQHSRVLGVHIRGTDMKNTEGHPVPPSLERMVKQIAQIISKFDIDGIFISTDEQESLKVIKQRFGDMVFCTEAIRANSNKELGIHLDKEMKDTRKNHRYHLGVEVLTDMMILSKCNILLCGHSNVAYTAMIFNNNQYEEIFLLD